MGRFDIRETTALDRGPEPDRQLQRDRGPEPQRELQPGRAPERPGHRPNYDPRRPKQDITERMNAAVADIGHYRVVAVADLVKERFGGNPFTARKAIDQNESQWPGHRTHASGTEGRRNTASCLPPPPGPGAPGHRAGIGAWTRNSASGTVRARSRATWHMTWPSTARPGLEQARIEGRGARLRRVRTDAELKAEINSRSEAARGGGGRDAADRARLKAAEELHLPVQDGKVQYPDAQLEYLEPDGLTRGHVNIEVVSGNYRAADIAAKAAAGFQMHGNGSPRAQSLIAHCRETRPLGQPGQWRWWAAAAQRGQGAIEL